MPSITIYLYGYTDIRAWDSARAQQHTAMAQMDNVVLAESRFIDGIRMYNLTKAANTFVLSFSEIPDQCYYSNRVPMLLGYSALVVQERFRGIEQRFSERDMIVYSSMKELRTKMQRMIDNHGTQRVLRRNALRCSKKYTFDHYLHGVLSGIDID